VRRKTKLVVSGVGIALLVAVLATTTMSATTQFVTPTSLQSGDYGGDWVNLEGIVDDLETEGRQAQFEVTDENATVTVVYEGTLPETMANGRVVVAKGKVRDGRLVANQLSVRAHEGSDNGGNGTAMR
jgi:cytochrome c-type biogenesis protein CcmE